jgi:hypothetical protein
MDGKGIFGAVDDSEVFAAAAFDRRLHNSATTLLDEMEGLNNHAFSAPLGMF